MSTRLTTRPNAASVSGLLRERVAADGVEDDVDALSPGQPGDRLHIVFGGEVDRLVGAERAHEVVVAGARRRDHPRADRLGDLDRDRADAARAAVDEDRLADLQLRALDERLPDRAADERQARRLEVGEVPGLAADELDVGDVLLGVGACAAEDLRRVVDLIADGELANVRTRPPRRRPRCHGR